MIGTSAKIFLRKEDFTHIMHGFFLPRNLFHSCGNIISFMGETPHGSGDGHRLPATTDGQSVVFCPLYQL